MEGKVILYDSNNIKIGETYVRRAKQLVKQQRAYWTDDSQSAVRFFPGAEHLRDPEHDEAPPAEPADIHTKREKHLMQLAKRRVVLRRVYTLLWSIHLAVNAFFVFIWLLAGGGYFWPIWPISGWGLGLIIVGFVFKLASSPRVQYDTRVEDEYNKLRKSVGMDE